MKAVWQGRTIAESDETVIVEGNHYFPRCAVGNEHLAPSDKRSTCPWKGEASYFDVRVGDEVNPGAAWSYPEPKAAAEEIRDHMAFWRGVAVEA